MNMRAACFFAIACLFVATPLFVNAETTAELESQIAANNAQIAALDAEIAQFQAQLNLTTKDKDTLQKKIKQLDLQRKQLQAKVSVTKSQIRTTQLQVQQLADGIQTKEGTIAGEEAGLAESLRILNRADKIPLALSILSSDTISTIWQDADVIYAIQQAVRADIERLGQEKKSLADSKSQAEEKHATLLSQQRTLSTQQGSLDVTRRAQNDLLEQTKSKESAYQAIIALKEKQQAAAEADIYELSQRLQAADTSRVPTGAHGVLAWPLDSIRITQVFGKTTDSGRLYTSGTHSGIDFAADIGTPVRASLSGTVMEINYITAAQDRKIGYCQYGSWVLLKHANGLATLYSHLSQVNVSKGESVSIGDVIGYSGNTGYATGPHLHMAVYNVSSVSFKNYKCSNGSIVYIPVAPTNGYLDPSSYLP